MPRASARPSRVGWWNVVRDDNEAFELRTRTAKLLAGACVLALGAFGGVFALAGWLIVSHLETYRFDLQHGVLVYRSRFHPSQSYEAPLASLRGSRLETTEHRGRDSEGRETVAVGHHVMLELAGRPDVKIDAGGDADEVAYLVSRLERIAHDSFKAGPIMGPPAEEPALAAPQHLRIVQDGNATHYGWRYARLLTVPGAFVFLFAALFATPVGLFVYFLAAMLTGREPLELGPLAFLGLVAAAFGWVASLLARPLVGHAEIVLADGMLHCRSRVWGRPERAGTGSFAREDVAGVEMESEASGNPVLVVRSRQGGRLRLHFPTGHGHFSHDDLVWIQRQVDAWRQGARS